MFPAANAGVPKSRRRACLWPGHSALRPNDHRHHALGGGNVDPIVGSHARGVVIAESSQPFVIQQLSGVCFSTVNQPAVLESIKASVVVQGGRNAGYTSPVRPGDICLRNFTLLPGRTAMRLFLFLA